MPQAFVIQQKNPCIHYDSSVCYYHVTYAFQSESTFYSCLNVEELLAQNRRNMWILSVSNGIRTHNHLVIKRTLNHVAKPAKLLSCVVSIYLYGAFDCMLLSCHVRYGTVWLSVRLWTKLLWVWMSLLSLWFIVAATFLFTPFAFASSLLSSTKNEYIFCFNSKILQLQHPLFHLSSNQQSIRLNHYNILTKLNNY